MERPLVDDEGIGIAGTSGGLSGKTLGECKTFCVETAGCNSITWHHSGECWLKEKCVTKDEPSETDNTFGFKSYYMPCTGKGIHILKHIPFYFMVKRKPLKANNNCPYMNL